MGCQASASTLRDRGAGEELRADRNSASDPPDMGRGGGGRGGHRKARQEAGDWGWEVHSEGQKGSVKFDEV